MSNAISIPDPELQVHFAKTLLTARGKYLQLGLRNALASISLEELDSELHKFAPKTELGKMARQGLRGELLFAVPCLLKANPMLLGYYRLLLGFSQKAFYVSKHGLSRFKSM